MHFSGTADISCYDDSVIFPADFKADVVIFTKKELSLLLFCKLSYV
jgi:hypothetical protein